MAYSEPVSYDFYRDTYHGQLDEAVFARLAVHAAATVDALVSGRASASENVNVAFAQCAAVDTLELYEHGGPITGETSGKYSVTRTGGESTAASAVYNAARPFLEGTGLLYRGVAYL